MSFRKKANNIVKESFRAIMEDANDKQLGDALD